MKVITCDLCGQPQTQCIHPSAEFRAPMDGEIRVGKWIIAHGELCNACGMKLQHAAEKHEEELWQVIAKALGSWAISRGTRETCESARWVCQVCGAGDFDKHAPGCSSSRRKGPLETC
jgi:hypothetical protein